MVFVFWDFVLLGTVTFQVIIMAYVHHPKWKAFILTLPIPFTFSAMAVGRSIGATNVAGLGLSLIFMHVVRLLYTRCRVPIIVSITIPSVAYCLVGIFLAGVIPQTDLAFWVALVVVICLAIICRLALPPKEEPGHRSPIPLYYKVPLVLALIFIIIMIKKYLKGFMTFFPMLGVFVSYETRKSLWTTCREVPLIILLLGLTLIVIRLSQSTLGLGTALIISWTGMIIVFIHRFLSIAKKIKSSGVNIQ